MGILSDGPTPEITKALAKAIGNGFSLPEACKLVGIKYATARK